MSTCFILCLVFFLVGFLTCALGFKFWLKKKQLTEAEIRKLTIILQDKYLKTEDKIKKILEIIKS